MSKLIRISESNDWIVDYDRERGMYRVSYFEGNHFVDEHWFDAYEDKECNNATLSEDATNSLLETLNSSKIKPYSQESKIQAESKLDEIIHKRKRINEITE